MTTVNCQQFVRRLIQKLLVVVLQLCHQTQLRRLLCKINSSLQHHHHRTFPSLHWHLTSLLQQLAYLAAAAPATQ